MLVSTAEGYRQWAETYDESPNPIIALEARYLAEWLAGLRGKRVIDVGCGTGRWIESMGGIGVDLSREMLTHSRAKGRIVQGDALRLPFASAAADVVLCTLSLGYMSPVRTAMEEMRRVARPGGVVIVTDVHPEAVQRGWKHSFRSGGVVYEVENRPYSLEDLSADGLMLKNDRSLFFGEPERAIFERTGKADFFEEARKIPALWMLKWRVL